MPILGANSSGGSRPSAPVIGSATDGGTGTTASVAFTPSTYIGKGTITYTATSSPGSITATSSSSPITVSGLTTGTAYTFTVQGSTNYGVTSATSSASNSVTPASPSSFESIASFSPTSGTSVTFSSIPSTYKSLQLRITGRSDTGGFNVGWNVQLNGATGSVYTLHELYTDGSTVYSFGNATGTYNSGPYFEVFGSSAASNILGVAIVDIIDYASTTKNKIMRMLAGSNRNGAGGTSTLALKSSLWTSTDAISSITIYGGGGNLISGTSIALYGIKG
jgi:hypothetical protein